MLFRTGEQVFRPVLGSRGKAVLRREAWQPRLPGHQGSYAAVNIGMHVSFLISVFIFFG